MSGNGLSLTVDARLQMAKVTDCELPDYKPPTKEWQINEQTKQDKSKLKSSVKDNPHTNSKINQETDYSVPDPDRNQ